ncbi:hypothetical protein AB0M20_41820, partial [Actinoplanes sp. NPDC051633]|uniref:hypothetical protein n=1 Tax=Actinoplanes sp. NPDC051633 TaxID=3155670 RepID=UPI0034314C8A
MRTRLALLAAIVAASTGAGSPAAAVPHRPAQVVAVHGAADGSISISRHTVRAGRIVFRLDSAMPPGLSSGITLVRPAGDATLDDLLADARRMMSDDAATRARGARDAARDGTFHGLADILAVTPVAVTQTLRAGTYYLIDLGVLRTGTPPVTVLRVRGTATGHDDAPRFSTVFMARGDRFIAPPFLPANGTITVVNASPAPHFMNMWPVRPGTTDAEIQAWIDAGAPGEGPLVDGPAIGLNTISPGRRADLTYRLPPGPYVLFCELPDDRTG